MKKIMKKTMSILAALTTAAALTSSMAVYADMPSNPVISRNCPAYDNSGESYAAKQGNDEHYFSFWNASAPNYLAYDLSEVPEDQRQKVMAVWYNTSSYDSIGQYQSRNMEPFSYTIEVNKAPGGTFPEDGWEIVETVESNSLSSRQHLVDMKGCNWIRMNVKSSDGGTGSNVSVNFDIHNVSEGVYDSWLFLGDSITAGGMNNCYGTGFATYVNQIDSRYFPIQENGGIGGIRSSDGRENIDRWLETYPGKYVSIAYGTNDAWGNTESYKEFYENTKYMIDAILAAGKIPVLPKVPYSTNEDVDTTMCNDMVELLYEWYGVSLIHGPDFYSFFRENPDYLSSDGVHPTSEGYDAMRQLWAETMYETVYKAETEDTSSLKYLAYHVNENGNITIDGCGTDFEGKLYIPSKIDNRSVETIEYAAFADCTGITSVEIAEGVKCIERECFKNCTGLTSVKIPSSLKYISGEAFSGCDLITEFNIPAGLTGDLTEAFVGMKNLKAINAEEGGKRYVSIDGVLYSRYEYEYEYWYEDEQQDVKALVAVPAAYESDNFIIPDTVTRISSGAMVGCSKITGITLPDTALWISESDVFGLGITKLHIPKNIFTVGGLSKACPYLEEITVDPENEKMTAVDGVLFNKDMTVLKCYPTNKKDVSVYTVPDSVKTIIRNAFYGAKLEEIIIPESVEELDIEAVVSPSLKKATVMNPDCTMLGNKVIANNMKGEYSGVIYGYEGSTAQKYADTFKIEFRTIGSSDEPFYGDANCDGEIRLSDAILVLQAIGNPDAYGIKGSDPTHITEQGMRNADVTGDKDGLTSADAIEIQRYILELIEKFD